MPTPNDSAKALSPEEFQALLAAAGLTISAEQAPQVMAELELQRANAEIIDAALEHADPPGAPAFDPTFPKDASKDAPK